jgi:YD repeat-containing protein
VNGQTGEVEWDVTADAQAFLDGTAVNYGWIIKKLDEGAAGRVEYSSREGVAPPALILEVSGDTDPPVITVTNPADGAIVNDPQLTVTGQLDEAGAVTVNGQAVSVDPNDFTFSHAVTLSEGQNTITITATDLFDNTATVTLTVTLDTAAPADPNPDLITIGDPVNGQVTVTGQAGSVEAGATVTITNVRTGESVTVTADANGAFNATLGGQTGDSYDIVVADAAGNTSNPVRVVNPFPPVLAPIGNRSVAVGQTLSLTLTASDPNGDVLAFGATPLPLPDNASLDAATGVFRFSPIANQVGSFTLTFSVTDGLFVDTEVVQITVSTPDPNADATFSGRLLDANDFANGVTTPIVGATVSFLGIGQSAISGTQGNFTITGLPGGVRVLDIAPATANPAPDGSPYAGFREQFPLQLHADNVVERPFFLPRIAVNSLTTIDPNATTVVTNPDLGISVTIPPHTAKDQNGNDFTGQMSISLVPRGLAPAELPAFLDPGLLATLQPVGVTFTTPVPVTFPNFDNLATNNAVNLWSLDANLGTFAIVGTGEVSADGTQLLTTSGGMLAADWFAMLPSTPTVREGDGSGGPGPGPCGTGDGGDGIETLASTVILRDGCVGTAFSLPPYTSLGASRALTFSYKSARAFPQPMIPFEAGIPFDAPTPRLMSSKVLLGGVKQPGEVFLDTSAFDENADEALRGAVSFDATLLPTGVYRHEAPIFARFDSSVISASLIGTSKVVNEIASPFGAGWNLSGLARLQVLGDDSAFIVDGAGAVSHFAPGPDITDLTTTVDAFVIAPPASVVSGAIEGNRQIRVFTERTNFVLPVDIAVDVSQPTGRIDDPTDLTPSVIPAGTVVNSYFVHFDPIGAPAFVQVARGDVIFDQEVLGAIVLTAGLDATDAVLGAVGTTYPTGDTLAFRGLELSLFGGDIVGLNIDRRTFNLFNLNLVQARLEQLRILTVGAPPPTGPGDFIAPPGDFSTLARNADGSFTRTRKDGTEIHFDAQGLQTAIVDRNGNTTSYAYDVQGRLISITDPVGLVTTLDYAADHLSLITDPAGRMTTLDHDLAGNLIQVTFPDGTTRGFGYDSRHLMTSETNGRGLTATRDYDSTGRLVQATLPDGSVRSVTNVETVGFVDPASGFGTPGNPAPITRPEDAVATVTDAEGGVSTFEIGPLGTVTKRTDPNGLVTTIQRDQNASPTQTTRASGAVLTQTFDAAGNVLTSTEQFNGATTTFTYDPTFSLVTSVTDALNRIATFNRDANGNVTSQINAAGHITTMTYSSQGLVTQMTDPVGLVTTNTYDALGRLTTLTETPPAGGGAVRTTTFAYDTAGQLTQVNRPDGTVLTMTYDLMGRLLQVTDNLGNRISHTYDTNGNRTNTDVIDPDNTLATTLASAFDTRDRQITTTAPHAGGQDSITQFSFDGNGNLTGQTDPNGNPSTRNYDPGDRLIEQIDALNGSTTFDYDANDQITEVVAPNAATTTFTYDILGRRLTESSPDRGDLSFTYDVVNNLETTTDARGIIATNTYDALNRITSITYPDPAENVTFIYDTCPFGIGRLCNQTDQSGTYTYSYDAFGNITQVVYQTLGVTYTTSYTYDAGNNVIGMTLPSGRTVTFTRDGLRRIQAIDASVNATNTTLVSNVTYRSDQQVTSRTFGNGLTETRGYDQQGRLTSQALGALSSIAYSYDANGNVLVRDTRSYQYDPLDRLTDDTEAASTTSYSYDANGNRLTQATGTQTTNYAYNAGSNQLASIDANTLSYDLAGNLTTDEQGRSLTYNNMGRLAEVQQGATTLATYLYNAQGQRTRKVTPSWTTVYHYDLAGNLISETDSGGTPIRDYVWHDVTPIAQIDSGPTENLIFLHSDHLQTPRRPMRMSMGMGNQQSSICVFRGSISIQRRGGITTGIGITSLGRDGTSALTQRVSMGVQIHSTTLLAILLEELIRLA